MRRQRGSSFVRRDYVLAEQSWIENLHWRGVWAHALLGPALPMQVAVPHLLPRLICKPRPPLEPLPRDLATERLPAPGVLVRHVHHVLPVELPRTSFGAENPSRKGRYGHSQLQARPKCESQSETLSKKGRGRTTGQVATDTEAGTEGPRSYRARSRCLETTYVSAYEIHFEKLLGRVGDRRRPLERPTEEFRSHEGMSSESGSCGCDIPLPSF